MEVKVALFSHTKKKMALETRGWQKNFVKIFMKKIKHFQTNIETKIEKERSNETI
jgi:hypothetical protein